MMHSAFSNTMRHRTKFASSVCKTFPHGGISLSNLITTGLYHAPKKVGTSTFSSACIDALFLHFFSGTFHVHVHRGHFVSTLRLLLLAPRIFVLRRASSTTRTERLLPCKSATFIYFKKSFVYIFYLHLPYFYLNQLNRFGSYNLPMLQRDVRNLVNFGSWVQFLF